MLYLVNYLCWFLTIVCNITYDMFVVMDPILLDTEFDHTSLFLLFIYSFEDLSVWCLSILGPPIMFFGDLYYSWERHDFREEAELSIWPVYFRRFMRILLTKFDSRLYLILYTAVTHVAPKTILKTFLSKTKSMNLSFFFC